MKLSTPPDHPVKRKDEGRKRQRERDRERNKNVLTHSLQYAARTLKFSLKYGIEVEPKKHSHTKINVSV